MPSRQGISMGAKGLISHLAGGGFILLLAGAISYYSLGHYDHNDHMYAVAPVLAQHLRPYADFAFVQTPLSLLLFSEVYKLAGPEHFYACLRVLSLGLQLTIVAFGIGFCLRHARQKMFASLVFVGLYLGLRGAATIGAEIGNYTLSLALTAAALTLLDVFRGKPWTAFAVGVLFGLTVSAKLSYIYMIGAGGLCVLLWERVPANILLRLSLYLGGVLAGVAPILFYLFRSFDPFLFENVHFHYLSNIYRGIAPFPGISNLGFFSAGSAIVPLTELFLGCAAMWLLASLVAHLWPASRAVVMPLTTIEKEILCVAAAAVVGAVTPVIVFIQYLAAPAFALFLFAALYLDRLLESGRLALAWRSGLRLAFIALAVVSSTRLAYALAGEAAKRQHDGTYGISAVARLRGVLSSVIAEINRAHPNCHGDLVTAFGVPAIGAGANFSPISSAGSFAMRLDDIFAHRAPAYRWISDPMLYLTPRSLILSGYYADNLTEPKSPFEGVMDGYAARQHFQAIALGTFIYRPVFLYVPPACRISGARV